MILNTLFFCLVTIIDFAEPKLDYEEGIPYKARVIQSQEKSNRNELARLIEVLNGHTESKQTYGKVKFDEPKYKKQYNVKKKYGYYKKPWTPGVRIHFIRNPEVLDAFVKHLKKDKQSKTDDSDRSDIGSPHERRQLMAADDTADIRRNAEFRTDDHGSDEIQGNNGLNSDSLNDAEIVSQIKEGIEDGVTPFKSHLEPSGEEIAQNTKNDFVEPEETTRRFKIKSQNEELPNSWYIKQPSYDWKEDKREEKDIETNKDKVTEKFKEKRNEKDKKIEWDAPPKRDAVEEKEWNSGAEENKPKTKRDWDQKSKWDYDEPPKKNRAPVRQGERVNKKRPRKQKELWDSFEVDWTKKKRESVEVPPKMAPRRDHARNEPQTSRKQKGAAWNEPKKEVDNDWDKVGREWGKHKEANPKEAQKPSRNAWKPERNQEQVFERPRHVERNPEHHKRDQDRGGGFRGRTPIPFIGRHGIYDDKK